MDVALSPYHLTAREPVALAALLLARRVVTVLPSPRGSTSPAEARHAARRLPAYHALMQAWAWSEPLWRAGVLGAEYNGHDATDDVRTVWEHVRDEACWQPLRALADARAFEDGDVYLAAAARDLLQGGTNPAITVPISAGLDHFALRHGLVVARCAAQSLVQQAEERLGQPAFTLVVPVLIRTGSRRLLLARRLLEPELDRLRCALATFAGSEFGDWTHPDVEGNARAELAAAAAEYAQAFAAVRDQLLARDDEDDTRVLESTAKVTGVRMPVDAALISALAAARALNVAWRGGRGAPARSESVLPANGQSLLNLVICPVGRRSA